jgi:hypothetical protein
VILDNLLGVFDAKAAGHELGEEGVTERGEGAVLLLTAAPQLEVCIQKECG